jgi:hypothetical protein
MLFNLDDRPIVEEPFTIPVFSQVSHRAALHHILHCAPVAPASTVTRQPKAALPLYRRTALHAEQSTASSAPSLVHA